MSKSIVVAILAFITAAILLVIPLFSPQDYECSECVTTADCGEGLECKRFDDGKSRCVSSELVCTKRHINTGGTWTHMAAFAAVVVGGLAVSSHQLAKRIRSERDS